MSSDTSELQALITEVKAMPTEVLDQGRVIVHDSSKSVQDEWRRRWRGHRHLPYITESITIEVGDTDGVITGEIGPEMSHPQGRLGSFIELGTRTSGPHPGGFPAADMEEPAFNRKVEQMKILGLDGE